MTGSKLGGLILAGVAVVCVAFVVALFLIKILWTWTIPDLLPGAVEQGLVAKSISWLTAAKLAIFIAVLSGIARDHHIELKTKDFELKTKD
jgi:hypothetical protein